MRGKLGGIQIIKLNCAKTYNYDEIKSLCIEKMKTPYNATFLENAHTKLGTYSGRPHRMFEDFWDFSPQITNWKNELKIYLLSKPKAVNRPTLHSLKSNGRFQKKCS